jgi:hypothetical protein
MIRRLRLSHPVVGIQAVARRSFKEIPKKKLAEDPQSLPEVNRVTAVDLGKIGVNLNQQIRAMNTAVAEGQDIPNMEESLAVVEKVYEAVRALQGELLALTETFLLIDFVKA